MDIVRAVILVLDGVGVGELPDANLYGDQGSNTLGNAARVAGGLSLPNFERLGLGNLARDAGFDLLGVAPVDHPIASYGTMAEVSPGKDTTTGHWELAGIQLREPFPTYPNGFPPEVIEEFERRINRQVLGNYAASGTQIIAVLGEEHMRTGRPIVYTSADSVLQIAAHEDVIPVETLYEMCLIARRILVGPHALGRVIARPFSGQPGAFERTTGRRDFSVAPTGPTLLDLAARSGLDVMACGKIDDIFANQGITLSKHVAGNDGVFDAALSFLDEGRQGLVFANLIDFDMKWGHRNDVNGFAAGMEHIDSRLPELLDRLSSSDLLLICADHGNDPTTPSTDHSREYVPVLAHRPHRAGDGVSIGVRPTFADLGATVADFLGIEWTLAGESFGRLVVGGSEQGRH
ncbi:MAG: phosphopentomutase [Clostridia bacterium]|nr:phosphopentomutase [Clostridia bacterium]